MQYRFTTLGQNHAQMSRLCVNNRLPVHKTGFQNGGLCIRLGRLYVHLSVIRSLVRAKRLASGSMVFSSLLGALLCGALTVGLDSTWVRFLVFKNGCPYGRFTQFN